jgi:hypothetical protein
MLGATCPWQSFTWHLLYWRLLAIFIKKSKSNYALMNV